MNYIDLVLLLLLVVGLIQGIRHGLIKEIAIIVALIVGIYVAQYLAKPMQLWAVDTFDMNASVAQVSSYVLLFIAGAGIIHLLANLIKKLLKMIQLNWINRILGGLFGFLKYLIILSFLINILNMTESYFKISKKEQVRTSNLYKPVGDIVPTIMPFVDFSQAKRSLDATVGKMTEEAAKALEEGYKRL